MNEGGAIKCSCLDRMLSGEFVSIEKNLTWAFGAFKWRESDDDVARPS